MTIERRRPATLAIRRQLFEEATAIIALEYPEDLTLQDVAQRLFASPRQLQRSFADAGAAGFRECLRQVRMRRAAELLAEGLRVHEVSRAVGYRQPAQFARAFRHEFGMTPSQARRRRSKAPFRERRDSAGRPTSRG
jgi:AraC family transcriptional regulator, regulatory protein of adaptative response / methylphosphotriester-DNA alkyltransferase methyltransferase